jgi:hypothetical protein
LVSCGTGIGGLGSLDPETGSVGRFSVRKSVVMLDMALFTEQKGVNAEEIVRCEVTNWQGSVDDALRDFQWTRRALACIGLTLMADNRMIHQGYLDTRGKMETVEYGMEAKKAWQGSMASTTLTIRLKTSDVFPVPRRWVVFGL